MTHSGEWTDSKTAHELSVDFKCIEDVKKASDWNREMVFIIPCLDNLKR